MKIWSKPLLASLIATSLTLFCALKADGAQGSTVQNNAGQNDAGHNDAGMCGRILARGKAGYKSVGSEQT